MKFLRLCKNVLKKDWSEIIGVMLFVVFLWVLVINGLTNNFRLLKNFFGQEAIVAIILIMLTIIVYSDKIIKKLKSLRK